MLAIRNSAASEAKTSAAQTSRTGSSPDSGTKMAAKPDFEFERFSAGDGFMDASRVSGSVLTQKRLRFPEAFFFDEQ